MTPVLSSDMRISGNCCCTVLCGLLLFGCSQERGSVPAGGTHDKRKIGVCVIAGISNPIETPPRPDAGKPDTGTDGPRNPAIQYSEDAGKFDQFCQSEENAGRVYYVRNINAGLLIPCVCNSSGNWVAVPDAPVIRLNRLYGSKRWPLLIVGETNYTTELKPGESREVVLWR